MASMLISTQLQLGVQLAITVRYIDLLPIVMPYVLLRTPRTKRVSVTPYQRLSHALSKTHVNVS